jgi:cell division protease FtsH
VLIDPRLPVGARLPDGVTVTGVKSAGIGWQIFMTEGRGSALVAEAELADRWVAAGLIESGALGALQYGADELRILTSGPGQILAPVAEADPPHSKSEALAFAVAMRATRDADPDSSLHDAIYAERLTRLLPAYSMSPPAQDELVLGYWLTGGAHVSATSFRRLQAMMSWLPAPQLREVVQAAGFDVQDVLGEESQSIDGRLEGDLTVNGSGPFELPGRPELEAFFNEHVVDIVRNRDRYRAVGITFPSSIVLHGPPGTGKTFAVEQLTEFLGWPSFQIDASSIASPYIHDTSRKISQVFAQATDSAPAVLIIDEMDAFLTERDVTGGHHRVEEIAEFLRRIPEATENEVLVIGMTNRIDMIDEAVLRRGRFDHLIHVDFAGEEEMRALLQKLLAHIPVDDDVDVQGVASKLAGRPLSDAAFVVREAARLSAKLGRQCIDRASLDAAITSASRPGKTQEQRRVGFI